MLKTYYIKNVFILEAGVQRCSVNKVFLEIWCSVKKVFLETWQNSQENTCARFSILIKMQAWGVALTMIKSRHAFYFDRWCSGD